MMIDREVETLRFTIVDSDLGSVLVVATPRGVRSVALGDDPARLARELRDVAGGASLVRDDHGLAAWATTAATLVNGDAPPPGAVPLDLEGTPFQRAVWNALQAIPPGETRTYRMLAEELGDPRAARAVAGACARNRAAVLVPCHRVVRSDGGLGGYRWGIERKRALLEREGARSRDAPSPQLRLM